MRVWTSQLVQFVVPTIHPYPELIDMCAKYFHPQIALFQHSSFMVYISLKAIWDMLGLYYDRTTTFPTIPKLQHTWGSLHNRLQFLNTEMHLDEENTQLPQLPTGWAQFNVDVQDALSMLSFIFGQNDDSRVYDWQLAAIFRLKTADKSSKYCFDFLEQISQTIVE